MAMAAVRAQAAAGGIGRRAKKRAARKNAARACACGVRQARNSAQERVMRQGSA